MEYKKRKRWKRFFFQKPSGRNRGRSYWSSQETHRVFFLLFRRTQKIEEKQRPYGQDKVDKSITFLSELKEKLNKENLEDFSEKLFVKDVDLTNFKDEIFTKEAKEQVRAAISQATEFQKLLEEEKKKLNQAAIKIQEWWKKQKEEAKRKAEEEAKRKAEKEEAERKAEENSLECAISLSSDIFKVN